jgi:hypothetical protein
MRLLQDVIDLAFEAGQRGDRAAVATLIGETVYERAGLMHERAQLAESRAFRAERALDRICRRAGRLD